MYCKNCGKQIDDGATYCPHCGARQIEEVTDVEVIKPHKKKRNETLAQVGLVFCIIGTVMLGFAIFPLAWCLPMTLTISHRIEQKKDISIALKVCTLLFVSLIGGILLVLADELED